MDGCQKRHVGSGGNPSKDQSKHAGSAVVIDDAADFFRCLSDMQRKRLQGMYGEIQ